MFAVVYGIADPWTPGSPLYNWKDFDFVYNAYEAVTPGPCSGVGCCSNSSLTTLMHSPNPYSCYLPYYSHAPEFNLTVRPHPITCPKTRPLVSAHLRFMDSCHASVIPASYLMEATLLHEIGNRGVRAGLAQTDHAWLQLCRKP